MATSAKVTWGPTTVFNTNQGVSATSSTSIFGASPASAPPTPGFSGFSSNPVNSPSTSLFSPTSSAVAANPAAPANNAFPQVLGAPQQAALQAHMNAAMHQEASRLGAQLTQLHSAYSPFQTQAVPLQQNGTCRFQHIFYDQITQTQRLEKLSLPNYPLKPSHVSDEVWHMALTQNPDPEEYIPVLVTSAEGLHSRLVAQQSTMKLHEKYLTKLDEILDDRKRFNESIEMQMGSYRSENVKIRQQLLRLMQKFEMCRGKNVPLQQGEKDIFSKLVQMYHDVAQVEKMHREVQNDAQEYYRNWNLMQQERQRSGISMLHESVKNNAMDLLTKSKVGINELVKVVRKGERDVEILKKGLES